MEWSEQSDALLPSALDFGQIIWSDANFDSLKRGIIVQSEKGCIITPITKMPYSELTRQFQNFRQNLYDSFEHCCDSVMDLLDALSGNDRATSVAELSLNPLFRRGYSSLYKAIQFFSSQPPATLLKSQVNSNLPKGNLKANLPKRHLKTNLPKRHLKANLLRSNAKSS